MLAKSSGTQRIICFPSMLCSSNDIFTDRPLREVLVPCKNQTLKHLNLIALHVHFSLSFNNLDNCIGTTPGSRQGQTVSDNPAWAAKETQMMSTA